MRAIISNDCWGGEYYKANQLQFNTPTIGLAFHPDDYIHLLENFRRLIVAPLTFPEGLKALGNYPIGLLGGEVEVAFIHYASVDEAADKWARRVARLPHDDEDICVKVADGGGFSRRHLERFARLPFRKVAFLTGGRFEKSAPWTYDVRPKIPDDAITFYRALVASGGFDVRAWVEG